MPQGSKELYRQPYTKEELKKSSKNLKGIGIPLRAILSFALLNLFGQSSLGPPPTRAAAEIFLKEQQGNVLVLEDNGGNFPVFFEEGGGQSPPVQNTTKGVIYPTGENIPPNYEAIGVKAVQEEGWNGRQTKVYVLDTGADPRIAEMYGIRGYDAIHDRVCDPNDPSNPSSNCEDDYGKNTGKLHGSAVTAIVKTVVPEAKVEIVRMINGAGQSSREWLERAINYVLRDSEGYDGPVIINMSFGSDRFQEEDFRPLNNGRIIVITALGNVPNGVKPPAIFPWTTLDVASVDVDCNPEGEIEISRHWSSEIHPENDGMAPGGGNCLVIPMLNGEPLRDENGNLIVVRGTSGAAPHVAGLAAAFAGAGYQAGHSPTPEQIHDFFTNVLAEQLNPEQYDAERLMRRDYYEPEDVYGTPNQVTGYGLFKADQAIGAWLHYLAEGGQLGEISFIMFPGTIIVNKGGQGPPEEYLKMKVSLKNGQGERRVPLIGRYGTEENVRWLKGRSQLNLEVEEKQDSLGPQDINLGNEPLVIEVIVNPLPPRPGVILPTPTPTR